MTTLSQLREEQFLKCLDYLAKYFDLDAALIMTNRSEDYTIARYILIRIMCNFYTDNEIAKTTGLTRAGVNTIKNKFTQKFSSRHSVNLYNRINNELCTYFEV